VIPVGRVPKFLAVSPDGRWLVVSNWCGDDVSIVDTASAREAARVHVGRNPRGVAITADSRTAYIALMGEGRVVAIDLTTDRVVAESGRIGGGARHLNLSPDGRWLYVTLNEEGSVAKLDVAGLTTVARVATGTQPRSAVLSADGRHLYVVNYESASASKVDTTTMRVEQDVRTLTHPIGIAYDSETKQLWVACYVGGIQQFSEG
jgi:YVTN family beta-propeller protein